MKNRLFSSPFIAFYNDNPNHCLTFEVTRSLVSRICWVSVDEMEYRSLQCEYPSRITTGESGLTSTCTPIGCQGSMSPCVKKTLVTTGVIPLWLRFVRSILYWVNTDVNLGEDVRNCLDQSWLDNFKFHQSNHCSSSSYSPPNRFILNTHRSSYKSVHIWVLNFKGIFDPKIVVPSAAV